LVTLIQTSNDKLSIKNSYFLIYYSALLIVLTSVFIDEKQNQWDDQGLSRFFSKIELLGIKNNIGYFKMLNDIKMLNLKEFFNVLFDFTPFLTFLVSLSRILLQKPYW
jgi:hypothetical protein